MYLETHHLFVRFSDKKLQEAKAVLEVRAWLSCPHCAASSEAVTNPELLQQKAAPYLGRPHQQPDEAPKPIVYSVEQYRATIISLLSTARYCEVCGLSSILPAADKDELTKQLAKALTQEWVEQQVARLATKLAHHERLEATKARRELDGRNIRRAELWAVPAPLLWEPPTTQPPPPAPAG